MHHYAVHDGCTEVEVHHADVKLSGSVVHTILSDVNILSDSVNRGGISLKEYNATGYKTLIQQGIRFRGKCWGTPSDRADRDTCRVKPVLVPMTSHVPLRNFERMYANQSRVTICTVYHLAI